jgi:hypothetical protein
MTLAAAAAAEATAQPETVSDSGEVDGNIWWLNIELLFAVLAIARSSSNTV